MGFAQEQQRCVKKESRQAGRNKLVFYHLVLGHLVAAGVDRRIGLTARQHIAPGVNPWDLMNNELRQTNNDVSTKQLDTRSNGGLNGELNGGLNGGLNDRQKTAPKTALKTAPKTAQESTQENLTINGELNNQR